MNRTGRSREVNIRQNDDFQLQRDTTSNTPVKNFTPNRRAAYYQAPSDTRQALGKTTQTTDCSALCVCVCTCVWRGTPNSGHTVAWPTVHRLLLA